MRRVNVCVNTASALYFLCTGYAVVKRDCAVYSVLAPVCAISPISFCVYLIAAVFL